MWIFPVFEKLAPVLMENTPVLIPPPKVSGRLPTVNLLFPSQHSSSASQSRAKGCRGWRRRSRWGTACNSDRMVYVRSAVSGLTLNPSFPLELNRVGGGADQILPMIRVAIVEDDRGTREGLVKLLRHSPDLVCVGAYGDVDEAEREIPRQLPDVVLMDINLGDRSGIDCVARLKRAHLQLQFLMLTTYDDSELIFNSLRAGASGYLLKRSAPNELIAAIEEGHRGGSPMSMQIARKVVSHFHQIREPASDVEQLTSCEREILALLTRGLPHKQIAARLEITPVMVRGHLHTIYGKLHVQSRTEAISNSAPDVSEGCQCGLNGVAGPDENGPNGL